MLAVAGLVVLWLVVGSVLVARQRAAHAVASEAAPLLVAASDLYVALADADTTASRSFFQAGPEPVELRRRYLADLDAAATHLTTISSAPIPPLASARRCSP